ncbi:MAG: preprotein translocase subunit YajC [Kordiimonadaceae bacterium]|nr:preprotein translocase subunit YajC [Kordiimonadaceae bacterium]
MFSSPAFAQAAGGASPSGGLIDFLPIILIVVVFWFMILRPQNKKMKEHRNMVANVSRGDTVVTAGGLIGKVTKVKDDNEVEVDLGDGVKVRVVASTLSDVRSKNEPKKTAAKESKKTAAKEPKKTVAKEPKKTATKKDKK